MSIELLRFAVVILALLVVGASTVIAARYIWASFRLRRAPGRILARHVALVAAGTAGLAAGYAWGTYESLTAGTTGPPVARVVLYLAAMLFTLIGVVEVGRYQRTRARRHPVRQAQVREAIRDALEGQPVTGPRSADYAAVLSANAVLALEGTPPMPPPDAPRREGPASTVSPTEYGRHAQRKGSP